MEAPAGRGAERVVAGAGVKPTFVQRMRLARSRTSLL